MAIRVETYAVDRPVPYLVQRGLATTLVGAVRDPATGSIVTVTSSGSSVQVVRPAGTDLVAAGTALSGVGSSGPYYDLAATASTEGLGEGYEVRWTYVISSSTYPTIRHPLILCEYVPTCAVTPQAMYARAPELRGRIPASQGPNGDNVGWQPQIDAAYWDFIRHCLRSGRPIWLLKGSPDYHEWMLTRAIQLALMTLPAEQGGWLATAQTRAFQEHQKAAAEAKLQYSDESTGVRRGASSAIRLAPVGRSSW